MPSAAEYRAMAQQAEALGKVSRARVFYQEADRLEREQSSAAGRPPTVSSGGAVSPPPSAPMPQTFMRPAQSTFVPEPEPEPFSWDQAVPAGFEPAGPPAPGDEPFPLVARQTSQEPTRGIGSQQIIAMEVDGYDDLLAGTIPQQKPPSMYGLDARTEYFRQRSKATGAIEDWIRRRSLQLVMSEGIAPDAARLQANEEASEFRRMRADPEGRPTTTGEGGLFAIPPFRETRIVKTEALDPEGNVITDEGGFPVMTEMYRDPDTGTLTVPTDPQRVVESFARQRVSGEDVERTRAERAAMVQQMMRDALDRGALVLNDEAFGQLEAAFLEQADPVISGYLTALDRESGQMTETAAGAGLRGFGAFPAIINEALMEYTPLFWEQNPETGEPVDPDSYAYRIHKWTRDYLESKGYTPLQIDQMTTGPVAMWKDGERRMAPGSPTSFASILPKPFQPVQRTVGTPVDPTGRRAVPAEATFMGRVAEATATGRSLGDEAMSFPALRGETTAQLTPGMGVLADQDLVFLQNNASTAYYWLGILGEMGYPAFPLAKAGQLGARGAGKAAGATAKAVGKAAKTKRASYLADVPPEMRALLYPEADVVESALKGVEKAADVSERAAYAAGHPIEAMARTRAIRRAQELTEGRYEPVNELDLLKSLHDVRRVTGEATASEVLAPYAIQATLNVSDDIWPQRLHNVIGGSPTGQWVLEQADLLRRPRDAKVSPGEIEKLRRAIAQVNASSMKTTLTTIARDAELAPDEQAQRILEQLHSAGIETRYLPEAKVLRQIADGTSNAYVPHVVERMVAGLPNRVQQVPQRPTIQALHELGNQLVRQAQSDEVRRISGETGRIMGRRLGKTPINRTTIADEGDAIFAAARAAGGRLVEATLANAVPDDLVFVTKSLMAPRDMLTDDLMDEVAIRYKQLVGGGPDYFSRDPRAVRGPEIRIGPEINGARHPVVVYPKAVADRLERVVGIDNIAQSRQYTEIVAAIRAGKPLNMDQSSVVQEAMQTAAFESVLGPKALPAMGFASENLQQFERAMQPGVNVGLDGAREGQRLQAPVVSYGTTGQLTSPLMQDVSMVLSEIGGRKVAQGIREATRKADEAREVFDVPPEAAPGVQEMLDTLKNEFAAISDNLQREMRDTALMPAYKGKPQAAFNAVLRRRIDRKMDEAKQELKRRADELHRALRMSHQQAYYAIAYQRGAGQELEGLGELAAEIPDNIAEIAFEREQVRILRREWESLLRDFFGDEAYDTYIESTELLDDLILRPGFRKQGQRPMGASDVQPISIKGLNDVIAYARSRQDGLKNVGAAVGRTQVTATDAIVPALTSWAIGADQAEAAIRAERALRREHPQLFVDLVPSMYAQRPERTFREASLPLTVRRNAVRALKRSSLPKSATDEDKLQAIAALDASPKFKAFLRRAINEDNQFYVDRKMTYAMDQTGKYTGEMDNIARQMVMNLDPAARQQLVEQVLQQMLVRGTSSIDYKTMLRTWDDSPNLSVRVMQKQAVSEALQGMIRGMDEAVASARERMMPMERAAGVLPRTPGRTPELEDRILRQAFNDSDADMLLYKAVQEARNSGKSDEFIVSMLRQSILESTFNTTIAPIVDELTANMRAAGFKPQLGEGSLSNMTKLANSLDPYSDTVAALGPQMTETVKTLAASSRSGQLAQNLEQLRRRDLLAKTMKGEKGGSYYKYALALLDDASSLSRRAVASGLLGAGVYVGSAKLGEDTELPIAVPMPNTRYIGMNMLTAPIIAMTTVGLKNAVRAYSSTEGFTSQSRDVARQLSTVFNRPLVNANADIAPDAVRFVSDSGRTWTQGELQAAIARNNLGSSRGQVEFTDAFLKDLQRDVRLMADGTPTPEFRQFARQFDPTRTNIAQYAANATDKALRENTFVTALQRGLPEAQAAKLAREVVLDYGAIPEGIRNTVNRHVLFASFRMANYQAMLNALARDPGTFRKLVRLQQTNQQRTDAWLLGPDYTKSRTLLGKEYVFDYDAGAGLFGPSLPPIDAMIEGMQFASFIANLGAEGNDAYKRVGDAIVDENLLPWMGMLIEQYMNQQDPTGRGMRVPTDVIEWAMQNSPERMWPYLKDKYNIVPVRAEDRLRGRPSAIDPQRPELGPNEYRFRTVEDANRFKQHMTALAYMGMKRTTTDYTNLGVMYNPSDYLQTKRQGIDPTYGLLFSTGMATPLPIGSISEPGRNILRKAEVAASKAEPQ